VTDARLSSSTVEKLGERLRRGPTPSTEDLALLQRLRSEYDGALSQAQRMIVDWSGDLRPTSRLKTVQTIIEKLQRNHTMKLQQVQDIAGLRIVEDMTLGAQDVMTSEIAGLFDQAKIVDRRPREKASHGYRAVHIIVRVSGRPVEVQVRTALQDRWAQITEKLGDAWGRQIRYGDPPDEPKASVGPVTRERVWQMVGTISPYIAWCEEDPDLECTLAQQALRRLSRTLSQSGVLR
jgi:hypothetical protein